MIYIPLWSIYSVLGAGAVEHRQPKAYEKNSPGGGCFRTTANSSPCTPGHGTHTAYRDLSIAPATGPGAKEGYIEDDSLMWENHSAFTFKCRRQ